MKQMKLAYQIANEELRKIFFSTSETLSSELEDTGHERREAIRQTEQRISSFLLNKFPEISDIFVYQDSEGICATFTFPQGKMAATWHSTKTSISYFIQDKEAAIAYFAKS